MLHCPGLMMLDSSVRVVERLGIELVVRCRTSLHRAQGRLLDADNEFDSPLRRP